MSFLTRIISSVRIVLLPNVCVRKSKNYSKKMFQYMVEVQEMSLFIFYAQ